MTGLHGMAGPWRAAGAMFVGYFKERNVIFENIDLHHMAPLSAAYRDVLSVYRPRLMKIHT